MKGNKSIHIGTSGWHYSHWKGPFYPQDLSSKDFLGYYAKSLHSVEINNSFYQMPQPQTLREWHNSVLAGFTFAFKASRYITHIKKLKDPEQPVSFLLERVQILEEKLGPLLFQLPPRWNCNPERLKAFLKVLPKAYRYAFEFRDPTWFNDSIYEILARYGAAFCIYHLAGRLSPKKITADFIYVRLHGPEGAYQGQYDTQTLSGWAGAFSAWARQGKEIYCYFDNDQAGYAAQDALRLQKMMGER